MRSIVNSVGVSLDFGSSAWLEVERGLLDEGIDAVSCSGTSAARWKDTVLCMPILSSNNIWSLTLVSGKGAKVFGSSMFQVAVTSVSTSLSEEIANSGLSM